MLFVWGTVCFNSFIVRKKYCCKQFKTIVVTAPELCDQLNSELIFTLLMHYCMAQKHGEGPTAVQASLHQHMLVADMVVRQDLQPRAMGKDRTATNHRLRRSEEIKNDWTHPAKTTSQYSQISPRFESSRHQAKRKTHTHLAQNPRHKAAKNKNVFG